MVTVVADRMTPPAGAIADRYSTLAAILIVATVLTTLVVSRGRAGAAGTTRRGRDSAGHGHGVVFTAASGCTRSTSTISSRNRRPSSSSRPSSCPATSVNFLRARADTAPPRPRPATWERDEEAVLRYEQDTALLFEAQFGPQVRRIREMFSLRGLIDRDFEAFYRDPSNAFQIGVVSRRLACWRTAWSGPDELNTRSASFFGASGQTSTSRRYRRAALREHAGDVQELHRKAERRLRELVERARSDPRVSVTSSAARFCSS